MQEFWEQRYSEKEYAYGVEPNAFLVSQANRLSPGSRVLVVGDGEGRNGVWLAQQGMQVTSVDYSRAGLKKAEMLADAREAAITTECADLTNWNWPVGEYDAVVAIFVHFPSAIRPGIHVGMVNALKPGGLLVLEAFHKDQLQYDSGGPPNEDMLYTAEMLREDVKGPEILLLEEVKTTLAEGRYHNGDAAVVRLLAKRGQ